jgi:hypothetical protein
VILAGASQGLRCRASITRRREEATGCAGTIRNTKGYSLRLRVIRCAVQNAEPKAQALRNSAPSVAAHCPVAVQNAPRRTRLQPNFVRNPSRRGQSSRRARDARMGRALLRRDAQRERRPGKNREAVRLSAIDPDQRSPRPQITRRARWIKRAGGQSGRPALGRGSIRFSRRPFCRVELGLAEPWVLR